MWSRRLPLLIRGVGELVGGEDFGDDDLFQQGRKLRFLNHGGFEYPEKLQQLAGNFTRPAFGAYFVQRG